MGPNSDLSHLLKQHNYYPTQSLLLTVKSLPPPDHCVRGTTFYSEFHIILFWPSPFFQTRIFFSFQKMPFPCTISCFTILHNCLCKEQPIEPTMLLRIFLPILHISYSRSQKIFSPPHLDQSFQQTTAPSFTIFFLFWAWASSLKWLPTVSQTKHFELAHQEVADVFEGETKNCMAQVQRFVLVFLDFWTTFGTESWFQLLGPGFCTFAHKTD